MRRSTSVLLAAFAFSAALSPCNAQQQFVRSAEPIQISVNPLPFVLQGLLRHPDLDGRLPAVVLLPICEGYARSLDQDWGARIAGWGFVTLTLDSYGAR